MMSIQRFYPIALAAILACAPPAREKGIPPVQRMPNLITAEEMASSNADITSAYDAIARLRPNWMVAHGVAGQGNEFAVVYVDGHPHGDLSVLRNIPAYHVGDLRYYNITEAGARFGLRGGTGGVIDVRMKSPTRR